jgi:choline dehydrogenase-like flavoprotein
LLGRYVTDHPRLWYILVLDRTLTALDQPVQIRRAATDQHPFGWQQSLGLAPGASERFRAWLGRPGKRIGVNVFGTQLPDDRQSFEFGDHECPLRSIEYSYTSESIDSLTGSVGDLGNALAGNGIRSRVLDIYVDGPGGSVHWSGGARMHSDPAYGVVDSYGEVHDAPGVSVCDASVFTTLPEKNPTLTSMALAMRAADRVADDLSNS